MGYLNFLLLIITFSFSNNISNFRSPMIIGDDYEFKINEHPKCKLHFCVQALPQSEFDSYITCKNEPEKWENDKLRYGLEEDEALAICIYTKSASQLSGTLSKGNAREYACYTDYLNSGLYKIWSYTRNYNMTTFSYLYTGIGLEDAKSSNFIKGTNCLLKEGDKIMFPSYGSTSAEIKTAKIFATEMRSDIKGGMVFNITTLKSKTKAVLIQRLSHYPDEAEYLFLPGSKFEVISSCKRQIIQNSINKPQYLLYYVELKEVDEFVKDFETQMIDKDEDKLKEYTKVCSQCNDEVHNFCKFCAQKDKCSECYAGYIPDKNGKCIKCEKNCLKCDSKYLNECKSCLKGYGLLFFDCLKCVDENCIECNGDTYKCNRCKNGFVLINEKCEKKDTLCKTYDSEGKCTECIGATYLEDGMCIECNKNGIENCAKCSKNNDGEVKCTSCLPGFAYYNNYCYKYEEENKCEAGDIYKCLKCEQNYVLYEDECYKCGEGCLKCQIVDNEYNCIECYSGYLLTDNKICDQCPDGCESCILSNGEETCTSCLPGFVLNNGKCDDCKLGCGECTVNKECSFCSKKFGNKATTLDKNTKKCVICDEGCERCRFDSGENKCEVCSFGYVMNSDGKCKKCNSLLTGCFACDYNLNNKLECKLCLSEYTLYNGECKICDISRCDICEIDEDEKKMCLSCEKNYLFFYESFGLKNGKCERCNDNGCQCFLNSAENILECGKKDNSLINHLNLLMFILLILYNYY